jgi:hypothetical protein
MATREHRAHRGLARAAHAEQGDDARVGARPGHLGQERRGRGAQRLGHVREPAERDVTLPGLELGQEALGHSRAVRELAPCPPLDTKAAELCQAGGQLCAKRALSRSAVRQRRLGFSENLRIETVALRADARERAGSQRRSSPGTGRLKMPRCFSSACSTRNVSRCTFRFFENLRNGAILHMGSLRTETRPRAPDRGSSRTSTRGRTRPAGSRRSRAPLAHRGAPRSAHAAPRTSVVTCATASTTWSTV